MKLVHVIGLHIKDNHADALQGAALTAQLLQKVKGRLAWFGAVCRAFC
jgi:hypothetical protein